MQVFVNDIKLSAAGEEDIIIHAQSWVNKYHTEMYGARVFFKANTPPPPRRGGEGFPSHSLSPPLLILHILPRSAPVTERSLRQLLAHLQPGYLRLALVGLVVCLPTLGDARCQTASRGNVGDVPPLTICHDHSESWNLRLCP